MQEAIFKPYELLGLKIISDFPIPKDAWITLKVNDKNICYVPTHSIPVEPMSYFIRSFYKLLSFFKLSKKFKAFYTFRCPIEVKGNDKIQVGLELQKPVTIKLKENLLKRLLGISSDMRVELLMR